MQMEAEFSRVQSNQANQYGNENLAVPQIVETQIHWTPELLTALIHERIHFASDGKIKSINELASADLTDELEWMLVTSVPNLPREILVVVQKLLKEHIRNESNQTSALALEQPINLAAVNRVLQWYRTEQRPFIGLSEQSTKDESNTQSGLQYKTESNAATHTEAGTVNTTANFTVNTDNTNDALSEAYNGGNTEGVCSHECSNE